MSQTWYRTGGARYPGTEIDPVEIERETEEFVYINGRRNAKNSDYGNYFSSWVEAHSYLMARHSAAVSRHKASVRSAEENLRKVEALKPPGDKS